MGAYHLRRSEKAIEDEAEIRAIIEEAEHMTLALTRGDEPYLVTVNFAFDAAESCFYFHCATEGKKLEFLAANPRVWGQVLIDDGYIDGSCDHAFRTVQFPGTAEPVVSRDEKASALMRMADQLESDPDAIRERSIDGRDLDDVLIYRIRAEGFTGKRNS